MNPVIIARDSRNTGDASLAEVLPAAEANNRYAVLLLNDEQMAQLLQRPAMRSLNQRLVPVETAFQGYSRLMRRARVAMVALLLISAGAGAWAWAPLPVLSAFPWNTADAPPPIATGASFSLTIASPRGSDAAADMARRIAAAGTPSFVRAAASAHHVMVGPYASLDEAEAEQQRLGRTGVAGTRIFVDDSLRKSAVTPPVAVAGNPAMVLVGAGAHHSVVLEFPREPQQVSTKRGADGTVVVEMGPIDSDVETQAWSAPSGVTLLREIKIEEIVGAPNARHARATLTLPRSTMAHTRLSGRRVYIDLMPAPPPPPPSAVPAAAPAPKSVARKPVAAGLTPAAVVAAVAATASAEAPGPSAVESLRPVVAKFERLVPFLESAMRTPTPDVLRALASSVNEVAASVGQVEATTETADAHSALKSALASARRAVDAGFTGDRVAEARQAGMLVEAAKTVLPATP